MPCEQAVSKNVKFVNIPTGHHVCKDCVAMGGKWLHLRMCLECGHIGCCDDSPNRHARKHFEVTGHPLIRSIEPNNDNWSANEQKYMDKETWVACFLDVDAAMDISEMPAPAMPKHRKVRSVHAH